MWYLTQHPETVASDFVIRGILRYNHAKGIQRSPKGGYHETLTSSGWASDADSSSDIRSSGPWDLVHRFLELRRTCTRTATRRATLELRRARALVEPDLMSLEELVARVDEP